MTSAMGNMISKMQLTVRNQSHVIEFLKRNYEILVNKVTNLMDRMRNLEIQNSDLNQRTIALEQKVRVLETQMESTKGMSNRIAALEVTVTKEMATAKALREVETMAMLTQAQVTALDKDVQEILLEMTPNPKMPVVENLDALEMRLMGLAMKMTNPLLSTGDLHQMAASIQGTLIPMVRAMK